jgi:hypothetical protein
MMQPALDQFRLNVSRAQALEGLHAALRSQTTSAVDLSDILRCELVLLASALDHFIHELVRIGMVATIERRRPAAKAFDRFELSLAAATKGMTATDGRWVEDEVRARHGWRSFQHPDKIADAVRLISDLELWISLESRLSMPASKIKVTLALVVDRRNKIAHEADADPSSPGARWPIDETLVAESREFISRLGEAIAAAVI